MHILETKVAEYISQHQLLDPQRPVGIGLSGGADSVALLHILQALGYDVVALHCNFHLRGMESDRDAQFVEALCQQRGVPYMRTDFDTRAIAAERGISIEMAARDLRYHFFDIQCQARHLQAICVAHHSDDQVETLLLHMVRGTGIRGLMAMAPRRDYVVRPLLSCTHGELCAYLNAMGQNYVTDSSNLVPDVQRNKLRLEVLPLLRQLNPAVDATLLRLADHARETQSLCDEGLEIACQRVVSYRRNGKMALSFDALAHEPAARTILHHLLAPYGFNRTQLEQILAARHHTGAQFHTERGEAVVNRGQLVVCPRTVSQVLFPIHVPIADGVVRLPDGALEVRVESFTSCDQIARHCCEATIDIDRLDDEPLMLRPVSTGDRFVPYGMTGSQLVSDYLTHQKVSLADRQRQLLLCAGHRIVWVVGRRVDNRCAVLSTTRRILRLIVYSS